MVFAIVMAGLVSQGLIFSLPSPVMPLMAAAFGAARGPLLAQMLFTLPSLGLMVVGLISGWLLDLAGLRRTLAASLIVYGGMGSIPLVTSSIPLLLVSRLLMGGGCAALSTSCTVLLVRSYSAESRDRILGYQTAVASVIGIVSLVVAGSISGPLGWHAPFAIYGLTSACLLVFVLVAVPARPMHAKSTVTTEIATVGTLTVLKLLGTVYVAAALLCIVPIMTGGSLPFTLIHRGVTDSLGQSLVISLSTVTSAVSGFAFGRLYQRIGPRSTFTAGLTLAGVGMIMIGVCPSALLTTVGVGLEGLGLGLFMPHLWTVTATSLPDQLRGRGLGFLSTALFLGAFLSPFVIGALNHAFRSAGGFTAYGAAMLVAVAATFVAKRGILLGAARAADLAAAGQPT